MKKGQQWVERILQWCILITGAYIIYRGTGILAETGWLRRVLGAESTAEVIQEITVQTYLPGYVTALEDLPEDSPINKWLEQFVPVLQQWYDQTRELSKEQKLKSHGAGAEELPTERKISVEEEDGVTEQTTQEKGSMEERTPQESMSETKGQESGNAEEMRKETETEIPTETSAEIQTESVREVLSLPIEKLGNFDYLLNHYFVVDSDTTINEEQLDAARFLETDLSIEKNPDVPQILIYHTHSQETFLDSVEGDESTSIIGIGEYLAELLEENYKYQVIHDTGVYDLVDGVLDRSAAYDYARAGVERILEENPTIEVIIDLHRDGVEGQHFVTEIDGKQTAQIMFFNGLSQNSAGQSIDYLYNPYIEENLAFSFQMQLAAQQQYPGFTRNIYLKGQRFNLHLRPRSLLVEAGTQLNTVEEERNAMEPLADLLNRILSGK